nr:PREDICTED: pre-mRNA 3'-end-processing factor FIP1 [Paralichthys olivaceus]
MSSESDSEVNADKVEDEEGELYQLIYDMYTKESKDREGKENIQIASSSKISPVYLNINAERRTHAVGKCIGAKIKIDVDALHNINETSVLNTASESPEEKPWKKNGSDISDYFNYGFNMETWIAYCKKQRKIQAVNGKLQTKARVQRGHTRHREKEPFSAHSSSGSSSILTSRESRATADVTGGRPTTSSMGRGHQCLSDISITQVVTKMSPEEDRITSYRLSPLPHPSSLLTYTSTLPFLCERGPPPVSPKVTLDSGHSKEIYDPPTSQYPISSGKIASSSRKISAAKAGECYMWQEKCDKSRNRSREHGHDRESKRVRERESESWSSAHKKKGRKKDPLLSNRVERVRHRDTMERGHVCHSFERVSGEEEKHKGDSVKARNRKKSPCSSSRCRRDDGRGEGKTANAKRPKEIGTRRPTKCSLLTKRGN